MKTTLGIYGITAVLLAGALLASRAWADHEQPESQTIKVTVRSEGGCEIEPPLQYGLIENWRDPEDDDDDDWRNDRQDKWEEWLKCKLGTRYTMKVGSGRKDHFPHKTKDHGRVEYYPPVKGKGDYDHVEDEFKVVAIEYY